MTPASCYLSVVTESESLGKEIVNLSHFALTYATLVIIYWFAFDTQQFKLPRFRSFTYMNND